MTLGEVKQCRFGLSYARIDSDRLLVGIVAADLTNATKKTRRRLRSEPDRRVSLRSIQSAISSAQRLGPGVIRDYEHIREEALERFKSDPDFLQSITQGLRKDLEHNLHQSHDFLQLVKLVRGYAEVLLNEKYPDLPLQEAAERLPTEGSIFFSTELMLVKMDSLIFMNEVNRAFGQERPFQVHPFVLKYVRIYRWQADQRDVKIGLEGQTYMWAKYNSQAIGAVVQSLLDNLVKYAPAGSSATVAFEESGDRLTVDFNGLGPRIDSDERSKIFLPSYRARAAQEVEQSGMGVGLATAKNISDALGLQLTVSQADDESTEHPRYFSTSFSFVLSRA